MAMNNYQNAGRRVRPTTPKLSKAQRIMLENMRDGGTMIEYFVSYNRPHASLDDPELRRYGRATVPMATFKALQKRGWIEQDDLVLTYNGIVHYYYRITDTGRAALRGVVLEKDYEWHEYYDEDEGETICFQRPSFEALKRMHEPQVFSCEDGVEL